LHPPGKVAGRSGKSGSFLKLIGEYLASQVDSYFVDAEGRRAGSAGFHALPAAHVGGSIPFIANGSVYSSFLQADSGSSVTPMPPNFFFQ